MQVDGVQNCHIFSLFAYVQNMYPFKVLNFYRFKLCSWRDAGFSNFTQNKVLQNFI